ncbi:MAG: chemotaxis protein CheX [Desulfomonilia bacterium]|nr:chemotaxis protein CheX [Deltaproteobacteria bacterium]MDX9762473.1 chemotaxis protein CheX [Desulfomonilia bacterium]HPW69640.1 chemotaxis protein CheX [Deltaproteobacteria bacterium]
MAVDTLLSSRAMENAVVSVLNDMAATRAAMIRPEELPCFGQTLIHAHITFEGPSSGELGLLMDPDFAAELASRILGVDEKGDLLQEMVVDAVKELLNVICGQFLTQRFGYEPAFTLGVPRVFPLSAQACNVLLTSPSILIFQSNDSIVPAYVRVKDRTA